MEEVQGRRGEGLAIFQQVTNIFEIYWIFEILKKLDHLYFSPPPCHYRVSTMPSSEEWAHVLEVVKRTGDEAAMSTLTSLTVVYVNPPKEENSVGVKKEKSADEEKEKSPEEESSPDEEKEKSHEEEKSPKKDKMEEVYGKILANAEASGDSAKVGSVKRAFDMTPDSEEEEAKKLLKMSETSPVLAASLAGLKKRMATLQAMM